MMHYSVVVICGVMSMVAPLAAVPLMASEPVAGSVLGWYFHSRRWERWRQGAIYRFLGVRLFKKGLLHWYDSLMFQVQRLLFPGIFRRPPLSRAAWRRANGQHLKHDLPCRDALISAAKRTKRFELIHLFILLPLLPIVIDAFLGGHYTAGLFMGGVFALMNVYPILLQRDNRARLLAIEEARTIELRGQPDGRSNGRISQDRLRHGPLSAGSSKTLSRR